MASAAPPLGPQLGQRGINVANFCKDFNNRTAHIKPGAVLPTRITVKPDRSYDLEICSPMSTWLIKKAAGVNRGKQEVGESASFGQGFRRGGGETEREAHLRDRQGQVHRQSVGRSSVEGECILQVLDLFRKSAGCC